MTRQPPNIESDFLRLPERAFRVRYDSYNIRCGILLFRPSDCKFLLVREKSRGNFGGNIYGPPKGSIEISDRTFLSAALRELREETAIVLNIDEKRAQSTRFVVYHHYFREILILFLHILCCDTIAIIPNQCEISECVWVSIDEAKKLPAAKCTSHILQSFATLLLS